MELKELKRIYDVLNNKFDSTINLTDREIEAAKLALKKFYELLKGTIKSNNRGINGIIKLF